jgi:hypothetical protein
LDLCAELEEDLAQHLVVQHLVFKVNDHGVLSLLLFRLLPYLQEARVLQSRVHRNAEERIDLKHLIQQVQTLS